MRKNRIDLTDSRAVVTGAARGLGKAIAERLLECGARVACWDVDEKLLHAAWGAADSSPRMMTAVVDVTCAEAIGRAAEATRSAIGSPTILVNSAGIGGSKLPSWEFPIEEWRRILDVNLTGTWLCCRELIPAMIEAGQGRIVNISSMSGKDGNPNTSAYAASKGGIIAMTKSMGKELATSGVLVNCVAPTLIDTELVRGTNADYIEFLKTKIPMKRLGKAEELAALVAWLCSDECSFNTGAVFDLSGGRATY